MSTLPQVPPSYTVPSSSRGLPSVFNSFRSKPTHAQAPSACSCGTLFWCLIGCVPQVFLCLGLVKRVDTFCKAGETCGDWWDKVDQCGDCMGEVPCCELSSYDHWGYWGPCLFCICVIGLFLIYYSGEQQFGC